MEAIKNVEYLCILLGKSIKAPKIKQFISLLADKYKETKSTVLPSVNRTLSVIIQMQALPLNQIIEHMICQVANSHKNPRVKQMILEKVDQTLKEEQLKEEELASIFKVIKDKILAFIQKDTNAGVRDAAVLLLTTFKTLLQSNQLVTDTVNTLPKYRIAEIGKKAHEQGELKQGQIQSEQQQPQIARAQTAKLAQKPNQQKKEIAQQVEANDFSYQGRVISGQYQIHLAEIILTLKKMKQGNFPDTYTFQEKCEEVIEKLGEQGILESKPVITSCINWLLSNSLEKGFKNKDILNVLLILLKKIYCIQRNVEHQDNGHSKELFEAIMVVMFTTLWSDNLKQADNLMNVLLSAAGSAHNLMSTLIQAMAYIKDLINSDQVLLILDFTFSWVENKLDNLLAKGMNLSEFEDLRAAGISFMNDSQKDEIQDQIIQIMVKFKKSLTEKKKEMDYMDESSIHHQDEQDEEEKGEVNNILSSMPQSPSKMESNLKLSAPSPLPQHRSKGQEIVKTIEESFEKGLLLIKELAHSEDAHDPKTKELVFQKLLSIVDHQCKNPQQQYQQAYALKALMWFKEEVLGLEDCFKYCDQVMCPFARTEFEGRDNSVELYLLNHWVKELSLRDLIDRLSFTCSNQDQRYFYCLFKWLMNHSLHAVNKEEKWAIEDFRKVSLLLAKNIKHQEVQDFFLQAVGKFGQSKVREFMEIQLMHSPQEYNGFMDWYSSQFKQTEASLPSSNEKQKLKLPSIENESNQLKGSNKFELDLELQNALRPPTTEESACSSARAKNAPNHSRYQKMRDKRKTSAQRKQEEQQESGNKYEDIIGRLESQLNQNKKIEEQSTQKVQQKSTVSSNFYYNISNRYEIVKTDEDLEEHKHADIEIEDNQKIQEAQNMLMASQVKETRCKDELSRLEQERQRIEKEREMLMREKNKETDEWKHKYEHMREQHEDVIDNLKEANSCYLTQVNENEDLKSQLRLMQEQHLMMMKKFEEIEIKLNKRDEASVRQSTHSQKDHVMMASFDQSPSKRQVDKKCKIQVVSEENLNKIEKAFTNEEGQMMRYQTEGEIGIKKIQELLLNSDKNAHEEIGLPLFFYYSKMKSQNDRTIMIQGLNESLNHEDVLYALSNDTYKMILHFLLKVFALEKAKMETQALNKSTQSYRGTTDQTDATVEVQKIVSRLLNSKEFTTSLVTLFQILKVSIPDDISHELTEEQKQQLRVVMRCVSRITKALHSEHPDLIRAFDVLIEMHKIFTKHPPENLREDLPSLQEFDYVYRTLKDVSDKLMELQPEKVVSFLKFVSEQHPNAFTKYMQQMMQCVICTEHIDIYAIGECGHNKCCWRCVLKQKLKQEKKECAMCKTVNYKVLLTKNPNQTIPTCPDAIFDLETDLYFADQFIKSDIIRKISNYCTLCGEKEFRSKFASVKQLNEHYKNRHQKSVCDLCLEHKPVLMFEQELFSYEQLNKHYRDSHPHCHFCVHHSFYDQDMLNRHYMNNHYFCDICKKQGKKKSSSNKRTNLPEYEVFRDIEEVRNHWKKKHFVCDKPNQDCLMLVFEDGPQRAAHYLHAHRESIPVQVGRVYYSDDEEEYEEEKKEQNVEITKENYKEIFPTLSQNSKVADNKRGGGIFSQEQFPQMPLSTRVQTNTRTNARVQAAKKLEQPKPIVLVRDKQSRVTEQKKRRDEQRIMQRIKDSEEKEDFGLEYDEANDNASNFIQEETKTNSQSNAGSKKIKKKKVIVENSRYEEYKEEENITVKKEQDYPSLGGNFQPIQTQTQNSNQGWNKVISAPQKQVQKREEQNTLQTQDLKNKQEFPTLPINKPKKAEPPKPQQHAPLDDNVKKKKNKKKKGGQDLADWSKLEKVDYSKNIGHMFVAK